MDLPPQTPAERVPLLMAKLAATSTASKPALGTEAGTKSTAATNNVPRVDSKRIIAKQHRPRKKISAFRRKGRDYSTWRGRIGVHLPVDEIDIKALSEEILMTLPGWNLQDHYDVMRLSQIDIMFAGVDPTKDLPLSDDESSLKKENFDAAMPEVYVFSFGAIVFWNFFNAEQEEEWMEKHVLCLVDVCGLPHKSNVVEYAADEIDFVYGEKSLFKWDIVELSTRESGEKLAVSFALAKSSLLSMYEWRLQRTIERNAHIPEELAKNGQIHMTREQISKEIGRIFLVKHGINLDSAISDTPEEFWEDDRFEAVYGEAMKYFQINRRLELVNNRLNMIQDLHEVLIEAVQNHHAVYLEWIIILLIVVEVVLDLFHLTIF